MKALDLYSLRQQAAWMWHASRGMRVQAALNAVLGVLMVGADFTSIFFTKRIVDIATGTVHATFVWAVAGLVATIAVRIALGMAMRWIKAMLGVRAQNRLQSRLFERMLQCQWQGRERHHSGDVLNRLEQDVREIVGVITETLSQTIAVAVRLTGAFFLMCMMDWRLAVTVTLLLPLFIQLSRLYVGRMRLLTREVRNSDSRIQSLLQESVQHRVVIKTLQAVATVLGWLHDEQAALRGHIRRRTIFAMMSGLTINIGFSSTYLITFIWAAHRLQEGSITYGMMLAFIQLVGQIQQPFHEMTRFVPVLVQALTAGERMMELEELPVEDDSAPREYMPPPAGFRLERVCYGYPDGHHEVLHDVSAHLAPGMTTAIVGETGAGKTTMMRLILGLLTPDSGTVEMYGDGWHIPCSARTRSHIVYVPQGNTLLSGSVRDNLRLARPGATDEEMEAALRIACADFVFHLPAGLDTPCGEQGAGMSEGQAQRICIARSLLRRGDVLLMDEATSALDEATELRLLENLTHMPGRHTIVFITHRPAVLGFCDSVVRL